MLWSWMGWEAGSFLWGSLGVLFAWAKVLGFRVAFIEES